MRQQRDPDAELLDLGRALIDAARNAVPVQVVSSSFGIFTANSAGDGPGILQNFVDASTLPINSLQTSAKAGTTIILWGTGLGPVSFPDNVLPVPGNLPIQTEVFVGAVKSGGVVASTTSARPARGPTAAASAVYDA